MHREDGVESGAGGAIAGGCPERLVLTVRLREGADPEVCGDHLVEIIKLLNRLHIAYGGNGFEIEEVGHDRVVLAVVGVAELKDVLKTVSNLLSEGEVSQSFLFPTS